MWIDFGRVVSHPRVQLANGHLKIVTCGTRIQARAMKHILIESLKKLNIA
jgi:hypothetical protein